MGRGKVDFDRGITRLISYANVHGHANPKFDEEWLTWRIGLWVSNLRSKFRTGRLSEEQIATAQAIGVRFSPPYHGRRTKPPDRAAKRNTRIMQKLSKLEDYYRTNGHINVRQLSGTQEWPGAGRWVARLRTSYRQNKLPAQVIAKAELMGIAWNPGAGKHIENTLAQNKRANKPHEY